MLVHGFPPELIAALIDAGLVTAHREAAGRGLRTMVTRLKITEAGRKAIA
jgi:hypothetical protein